MAESLHSADRVRAACSCAYNAVNAPDYSRGPASRV